MTIHRRYDWSYEGFDAGLEIDWPSEWLEALRGLPRPLEAASYASYVISGPFEDHLRELVDKIALAGRENMDLSERKDVLQFALAFVQHLAYYRERGEYPRYPMETVIDGGGDCEDTAILAAFFARHLGYDCGLLHFSNDGFLGIGRSAHMDLGIRETYDGEFSGTYWLDDAGNKYYYVCCNGENRRIGDFTNEFGDRARVYPV
jgi:hypothetical protein